MGTLVDITTPLHRRTARDYLARMQDAKVECMTVARRFDKEYWDGDRRYGYGGYRYDGRWKVVAEQLVKRYGLTAASRVLDIGCGKAHLLFELSQLLPGIELHGCDISAYAIQNAPEISNAELLVQRAQDPLPYGDNYFDLVISLNTLHNLKIFDLAKALKEMQRVGKAGYLLVESYRNELELFNLQCWALTCEAFFDPEEWKWLFNHFGYSGDYEFIYFE